VFLKVEKLKFGSETQKTKLIENRNDNTIITKSIFTCNLSNIYLRGNKNKSKTGKIINGIILEMLVLWILKFAIRRPRIIK